MTPSDSPQNGSRLDRIERGLEMLLQSVAKHDAHLAALDQKIAEILESQAAAENRMEARIDALDGKLDRIGDEMLEFRQDLKQLLTAQVLLNDAQQRTDAKVAQLTDNVNALVRVVDDLIPRPPPPRAT